MRCVVLAGQRRRVLLPGVCGLGQRSERCAAFRTVLRLRRHNTTNSSLLPAYYCLCVLVLVRQPPQRYPQTTVGSWQHCGGCTRAQLHCCGLHRLRLMSFPEIQKQKLVLFLIGRLRNRCALCRPVMQQL